MNEFIFGFEMEFNGTSERFVSEEAYKTQQKLKDYYMQRDQRHMETISELRKLLKEKQNYIKTLEERINNQKKEINGMKTQKDEAVEGINQGIHDSTDLTWKEKYDELFMCAAMDEAASVIDQLTEKVLNQRKELARLNKVLEKERKRNKELEELYSHAQGDVSMLNMKVMELNQGIRDSTDLTWKEKYDELEAKYAADSNSLNAVIADLRNRMKDNINQNGITCKS